MTGRTMRAVAGLIAAATVLASPLAGRTAGGAGETLRRDGAFDVAVRLASRTFEQGDPVLLNVSISPSPDNVVLIWKGATFPMRRAPGGDNGFQALFGIDLLDPPGPGTVSVAFSNAGAGTRVDIGLTIVERRFPVQELTLTKEMAVFDPPTVARIKEEAAALGALFSRPSSLPRWDLPLLPPLEPFRPKGFGARRVINGEPRAPHAGVDVDAPAGTPVRAIAGGTVVFAGAQFLGGNSVVIDHGGGLISLYYHLHDFSVRPGETVARGQRIGAVGATGRATGPHLHFGVRSSGGRIDPGRLPGLGGN